MWDLQLLELAQITEQEQQRAAMMATARRIARRQARSAQGGGLRSYVITLGGLRPASPRLSRPCTAGPAVER